MRTQGIARGEDEAARIESMDKRAIPKCNTDTSKFEKRDNKCFTDLNLACIA